MSTLSQIFTLKQLLTRAWTKSELATEYGISIKVFKGWCKRYGIAQNRGNYLTPKETDTLFKNAGFPKRWEDNTQ